MTLQSLLPVYHGASRASAIDPPAGPTPTMLRHTPDRRTVCVADRSRAACRSGARSRVSSHGPRSARKPRRAMPSSRKDGEPPHGCRSRTTPWAQAVFSPLLPTTEPQSSGDYPRYPWDFGTVSPPASFQAAMPPSISRALKPWNCKSSTTALLTALPWTQ